MKSRIERRELKNWSERTRVCPICKVCLFDFVQWLKKRIEKNLKLEVDIQSANNQIAELKELLETASEHEQMIEELSEKNMNLEEVN
jgi:hypothetical protein